MPCFMNRSFAPLVEDIETTVGGSKRRSRSRLWCCQIMAFKAAFAAIALFSLLALWPVQSLPVRTSDVSLVGAVK
jgi:hypothetical protein